MASLSRFGAALRFIIVCALCGFASAAAAQNYPSHNIRIIVPFAAGGLNDTAARIIQPYLEKALKQSVVVENKPGASGILGATYTAKSPPDGYTLTMVASSHTVLPATTANLPYDAEKDFAPIILLGKNPLMFVVNANVPAKTIQLAWHGSTTSGRSRVPYTTRRSGHDPFPNHRRPPRSPR